MKTLMLTVTEDQNVFLQKEVATRGVLTRQDVIRIMISDLMREREMRGEG